jgi:hypothetical protein
MTLKSIVQELDRDRYSRTGIYKIGKKQVEFPNFSPRIKNEADLDSIIRITTLDPPQYVGAYVTRLSDQPNEIFQNRSSANQRTLSTDSYAYPHLRKFYDEKIMIMDPSPEYLLYEGNDDVEKLQKQIKMLYQKNKKLKSIHEYLNTVIELKEDIPTEKYQSWKKQLYKDFWYELDRSQEEMNKLIGETHDIENSYNSDILVPYVPVILNEGMLDISTRVNKISNAIATKESASYLILNTATLNNDLIMKKINEYIQNDPNKITIFKIKYMEIYKPGYMKQRENYTELMRKMSDITEENKEKFFILLEGGVQSFPSAAVGFDMVSTSMTGLDGDGAFGTSVYGRWFYPKKLWSITYEEAVIVFHNCKNGPPHDCPACNEIYDLGIDNVSSQQWNDLRREHYVHSMNDCMKDITFHISQNQIELIQQELQNSEVSKLAELIPRM